MRHRRFRDLPLFWKFLLPFLGLLIVTGGLGTFVVVRNLSDRTRASLDHELARHSLDARTSIHDRELYVLEAVNFASNVRGMAEALEARDVRSATTLLQSVLALKRDLDLLVVTNAAGSEVAGFSPPHATATAAGRAWNDEGFFAPAMASASGRRVSGFVDVDGRAILVIAGPVCSAARACDPAGVAIAGLDLGRVAADTLARFTATLSREAPVEGISVFAPDGRLVAAAGSSAARRLPPGATMGTVRVATRNLHTLFAPLEFEGRPAGTLALTVDGEFTLATVRGTAIRLVIIILGTMVGVVVLMSLLSRLILVQVRPLVAANRALGSGNLSARVPVKSHDELGELARGMNHMAEELQASYETLEQRVADRTEEVQRLLRQRTEFFTALSHEFRTPLAVILGEADLLEDPRKGPTIGEVREAGKALRISGERLLGAVNQILALAQSDAGAIDVALEPIHLSDLVKELRPAIDELAKGSGLRLSVRVPRSVSHVVADRSHLKDVILNLVDNAAKYTPAGGSIEISAASRNGAVELSVADTGVGIPAGVGDRIFEPFYRVAGTKPVRGQASTGLGLSLAKRLVEAQGGRLGYENRVDGGTVFRVSLTRAGDTASA